MLIVIMLRVIILNVIVLNVILPVEVVPINQLTWIQQKVINFAVWRSAKKKVLP